MFRFVLVALIASVAIAQDAITVRVVGTATSENVVNVQEAVAKAVAKIESACVAGKPASTVATAAAQKVVEAAATATAAGGIFMNSTGDASGAGSVSASAKSTATAIAKAIADAIVTIADGSEVVLATNAIVEASESAAAAIEQAAVIQGTGSVLAAAAASSTVFVSAVAEALAAAAAACDANGQGTVEVATNTTSFEIPSFADFTSTQSVAAANIFGDGLAQVLQNAATASTSGNTFTPTGPAPAAALTPSATPISDILCKLGINTTFADYLYCI